MSIPSLNSVGSKSTNSSSSPNVTTGFEVPSNEGIAVCGVGDVIMAVLPSFDHIGAAVIDVETVVSKVPWAKFH